MIKEEETKKQSSGTLKCLCSDLNKMVIEPDICKRYILKLKIVEDINKELDIILSIAKG